MIDLVCKFNTLILFVTDVANANYEAATQIVTKDSIASLDGYASSGAELDFMVSPYIEEQNQECSNEALGDYVEVEQQIGGLNNGISLRCNRKGSQINRGFNAFDTEGFNSRER